MHGVSHPVGYFFLAVNRPTFERDSLCTDASVLAFAFGVDQLDVVEADSPRLYQQGVLKLTPPTTTTVSVFSAKLHYTDTDSPPTNKNKICHVPTS